MDKKKKIAIIIASVVLGILLIGGIVAIVLMSNRENIQAAQNTYDDEYHSYCTYDHAPEISIDGVLDENCWQNKNWFTNRYLSDTTGELPVLNVTTYVDDYGMYIAATVKDSNLVWNGQRSPDYNSNFEFYVVAKNVGEVLENDVVDYVIYNVDMGGDVGSKYSNVDRAVVVNGELNSGATESATLEMFIPWETMGVDKTKGIPKEFYLMPGYMAAFPGQEITTVMKPVWYPFRYETDYYVFNADGYTNVDREGAVVGDSKFGHAKTANWDLSKEADGIIRSSIGTENHKIFFKEMYGSNFIVETTIVPVQDLQNSSPKVGIYFQSTTDVLNAVMLDMRESYLTDSKNGVSNFNKLRIAALDTNNSGWNMQYMDEVMCDNPNASSKEGVKMTVIKYGAKYWVFLDGKFYTTLDYFFMDGDVIPGFFSLGGDVIFKNYSCKEIDENGVKEYLAKKDVYMIDAQIASAGGEVATSDFSVAKGGSYELTIKSNSGYQVSSVIINGKEKLADVKKNATGGVYKVSNVKSNQEIRVKFEKCEGYTFSGQVKGGELYLSPAITLKGLSNKALFYEFAALADKGFTVTVPAGKYEVTMVTEGYRNVVQTITISKDVKKNYTQLASQFVESLTLNDKTVSSKLSAWNLEKEYETKVSASYDKGGKMAPLYFGTTAVDFVAEATLDYTTEFKAGRDYQPDLMGGFAFSDGNSTGWVVANKSGITYTDFQRQRNLIDYDMLTYPDPKTGQIAIAKTGDTVYVYLDNRLVKTMKWSEIAPEINAKSTVAIGLYMIADKSADLQFSNYSLKTGTANAQKYVDNMAKKAKESKPLNGSALFAEKVSVAGGQVASCPEYWNLKDIAKGIVFGSHDLGTKMKPLYFNAHGSSILVEADIAYTTEFKAGGEYQWDLFGGFVLSDGKNQGWVTANQTGLTFTGWVKDKELVDENVLVADAKNPNPKSVKMTMAVKDGYVYVYFDGEFIWKQRLEVVVPNVSKDADLAVGLYMITDKTADIKFSNISISTNKNDVSDYINAHK